MSQVDGIHARHAGGQAVLPDALDRGRQQAGVPSHRSQPFAGGEPPNKRMKLTKPGKRWSFAAYPPCWCAKRSLAFVTENDCTTDAW
jgi:hypothetical protein